MATEVSSSIEEYLEHIYKLQERDGCARTRELSEKMGVTLGTITNTVEMLEREGFVQHRPYKGVRLTEEGRRIALNVVRRHRLAERLLTDILQLDWSKAHEAACRLEHGLTDDVVKPLGKVLGHPKTCPHGNPIPTKCGETVAKRCRRLIDLKPKESGTIVKFTEEDHDLLQHLRLLGFKPGVSVRVEKRIESKDCVLLKLNNVAHELRSEIASTIWVREETRRKSR